MKQIAIIILLSFSFISCNKESDMTPFYQNQLIGTWRLSSVTFNEVDGESIDNWVSNSTILSFRDKDYFFRNYIHGSWLLNDTSLRLIPKDQLNSDTWEYEILELTESTIKLKIQSTDRKYCCDFDAFASDEVLTIVETYTREE